ncbi:MAG TPA: hypothetical protein VIJ78_12415 [Pseudolabrys sp.]|nr:hypothetical protein [Pseudolabrys sp.]
MDHDAGMYHGGPTMQRNTKRSTGSGLGHSVHESQALEVLNTLVSSGTDPSRLLELYYWTREPGIIELIRAYLDLPEATQRSLGDFLLNTKPRMIEAAFDTQGRLVLSRNAAPAQRVQPEKLRQSR